MDSTASEFQETETGCNFCEQAEKSLDESSKVPDRVISAIIKPAFHKPPIGKYDCLIGLSGGVDSSLVLHKAVKLGLHPLCFSVDNGWNEPLADENIMRMVEKLKVPFYRYTIDLQKFKELQGAFLMAGVKNIEIPTDHILMATTYEMADKNNIKVVLTGGNVATESIMPPSWGYNARDLVHIKDIYKKFIGKKLTGLPTCSLLQFNYYKWIRGIHFVPLLDYGNYNREEAIKLLVKEYGWKPYGEKHGENVWTRWFQNFYLYEKFGIDKRRAHLSSLIVSGQMTRVEAKSELEKNPVYPELGIEKRVLKYPKHEHSDYKQDEWLFNFIGKIIKCVS